VKGLFAQSIFARFGWVHKHRPFSQYLDFKRTLKAAADAGLSVGEYIERKHSKGSVTPRDVTINGMKEAGVFDKPLGCVCEIGPGSGRYLESVLSLCKPDSYEIYETSSEWRGWLVERYGVIAKRGDGRSLNETESSTVDLVQAHRLFHGLPTLITISYLLEMARVARPGGWLVFDLMTETCLESQHLKAWFDADPWTWDWSPIMTGRRYVLDLLAAAGVFLVSSFHVAMFPAVSECLILRKAGHAD